MKQRVFVAASECNSETLPPNLNHKHITLYNNLNHEPKNSIKILLYL